MKQYRYQIYGSAHSLFPAETHFGLFSLEDGTKADIPQQYPFGGPWGGISVDIVTIREEMPLPKSLEILYLSVVENMFYYLNLPINPRVLEKIIDETYEKTESTLINIIVGMAPYGNISIWLGNNRKQALLGWLKTGEIQLPMSDFILERDDLSLSDYCQSYIENDSFVKKNLEENGLPPRDLFDNYMKQFTYRYKVEFGHWDIDKEEWKKHDDKEKKTLQEFDYIEEALFDGTHDKLHDGGLMNYHQAGKPKKLAIKWHNKKSEYTAYFWFEDEEIRTVFDRFYGLHPKTKTDFIIRIDSEMNKYELALFHYGLHETQIIPERVYQLLVFKNKFECFRSENYNQERGAWIW